MTLVPGAMRREVPLRRTGTVPNLSVIAGLDPAIHPLRKSLAKMMDARVKPAHDEL